MGLLDNKERIFDIVLTDKGRELLSKNLLNFSYFAFSDDGIDYSGSLSSSALISGSNFDDFIHTNVFSFEPIKRNDKSLKNFLFTMPLESEVVTQFNPSETGSFTIKRKYDTETLENIVHNASEIDKIVSQQNILDYVIVVEDVTISEKFRNNNYVSEQINLNQITPESLKIIK